MYLYVLLDAVRRLLSQRQLVSPFASRVLNDLRL